MIIWESQQSNKAEENYTKHYVYEPKSFVPLLQTGYTGFIKLLETPDYAQFKHEGYSVYKDPIWKTETRKNKAGLERVAFYHCDQVGTPQTLTNELGEYVWEIKQDTWGTALAIKASSSLLEQTNIRFQGQYYDGETGLHYNRYRYYEPFGARYVSKDPIGLFGGMNNFIYVKDPLLLVDPNGLMEINTSNAPYATYNYKFDFNSSYIDLINYEGKGVVKRVTKLATMFSEKIQPEPITFNGGKLNILKCRALDEKIEKIYKGMGFHEYQALKREEASKFLSILYKDNEIGPKLKEWYGYENGESMLRELDKRAKTDWSNRAHESSKGQDGGTSRRMKEMGL